MFYRFGFFDKYGGVIYKTYISIFFLVACVKQVELEDPPPWIDTAAQKSCQGTGEGSLVLRQHSELVAGLDIDWLVGAKSWQVHLSDPIGGDRIVIKTKECDISLWQKLWPHTPELKLDKNGFLLISKSRVGLKASEIACLLSGVLPWAGKWRVQNQFWFYKLRDNGRQVKAKMSRSGSVVEVEVKVTWPVFWIFKSAELRWYYTLEAERLKNVRIVFGDFDLAWQVYYD